MTDLTQEQQANVRLWVAALRSGEFQQACGSLRGRGGYCCLGVGCEVFRRATGRGEWDSRDGFSCAERRSSGFLAYHVSQWLFGEDIDDPEVSGVSLSVLNDTGAGFAEIADAIEREYLTEVA